MTKQEKIEFEEKIKNLKLVIDMYDRALGDVSLMLCAIQESEDANVTIKAMARSALCLSVNDKKDIDEVLENE